MPPAKSLPHPFARPITQCPYCDHVSPPGSKFCGECGAALHLLPCPHCGAVNDITVKTVCYRCHGELRESAAPALYTQPSLNTLPAPTSSATQIESVSSLRNVARDVMGEVIAEPPVRQRPHWLVVGIVLIAFVAAGYFAYRQRSVLEVREPARVVAPPASSTTKTDNSADGKTDTNAIRGAIVKMPLESSPDVSPPATATAPAKKSSAASGAAAPAVELIPTKPGAESRRESAALLKTPTPATPRSNAAKAGTRAETSTGLEKRAPTIGPCTEAVAALGLCSPDPSKR